jgi:hypothetical protein
MERLLGALLDVLGTSAQMPQRFPFGCRSSSLRRELRSREPASSRASRQWVSIRSPGLRGIEEGTIATQ